MIRFSAESSPEWLRNSLWWTSRFDNAAACLASPTIPAEDLFAEMIVRIAIQAQPR